ncbi:predicted protein [Plenodomus lingam JN3]|uniref:Predicted protein n=1 Tax=Leptosphaeria maculans (strain JN3 / isolate v23.1.3 / race Av1-4-5-6-7-8) TaxID=985895 RepID=E4ZPY9_LEPMJ|nr:predicted protein [Plenodomus lingam JN3]CBX93524.1 predicted protein [Plenodomus lingam JN3]
MMDFADDEQKRRKALRPVVGLKLCRRGNPLAGQPLAINQRKKERESITMAEAVDC